MNNPPKRHHYIPEFYQKGFLSESGELFVYNKKYNGISKKTPAQILYTENLHTMQIAGEKTLAIEKFYSEIEGELSKYISIIRKNIESQEIIIEVSKDPEFSYLAKVFTAFQFWRTPCKTDLAKDYSAKILDLYDKSDNEIKSLLSFDRKYLKFIQKRAVKDDTAKISQFFILPLLTFDIYSNPRNIGLFRVKTGPQLLSSDRPVTYDNIDSLFSFSSFIFPISKEILLTGGEQINTKILPGKVNELIFERAEHRVISPSKEQLEEFKRKALATNQAAPPNSP